MSTHLMVKSILELSNGLPQQNCTKSWEEGEMRNRQIKKPTDSKIKKLVQQQIVQAIERKTGALFPSATAPRVVIGLLSSLRFSKKTKKERVPLIHTKPHSARHSCHVQPSKRIPIGLTPCEPFNWVNSLIQFLLYLPGSWELFSLIPRSFQPLRGFADQYLADQENNRSISSADNRELVRCLIRKLPFQILASKPNLYEILYGWMKAIYPHCPFEMSGGIHPITLHPEWHVVSDPFDFEDAFQKKMSERPPEILVGFKTVPYPSKGYYFAPFEGLSYDLDSFVELRSDVDNEENYIVYLKRDGVWYQCDDDRVVQFRSSCLKVPLRRAVLLHYKRVELTSRVNHPSLRDC